MMGKFRQCALAQVVVVALMVASTAWAGDPELVLSTSHEEIHAGDSVILDLYLHNPTDTAIVQKLPSSLPCTVQWGDTEASCEARRVEEPTAYGEKIPARGYAKWQYAVAIPTDARETIRLRLRTLSAAALLLPVSATPADASAPEDVSPLADASTPVAPTSLDNGDALVQSYLENLSVHRPMYFLLGVDPGLDQTKFQFSFKYRLFNPKGFLAETAPWMSGFHIAYTQRSIWDLKDDSKPFEDTSYMPELFYEISNIDLNIKRITTFGIQGGYEHESNGKSGDDSRSTNYLYLRPVLGIHLVDTFYLKVAPKIFTYVNNSENTNDDIMDYRGYFDLEVGIVDTEGLALNSHLWWADEGATVQLDLTYPMSRLLAQSVNLYLHAQYFSGYAETLLHYNERHDAFRLGFSIVR